MTGWRFDLNIFNTGQTRFGAEKKRVCEVQQKVFQHLEGIFQGGTAHHRVHLSHLLDPPDQHGDDHSEGQVRVVTGPCGEYCDWKYYLRYAANNTNHVVLFIHIIYGKLL